MQMSVSTFQGKTAQEWLDLAAWWDSLPAGHYYGTERSAQHCRDNADTCRINAKLAEFLRTLKSRG